MTAMKMLVGGDGSRMKQLKFFKFWLDFSTGTRYSIRLRWDHSFEMDRMVFIRFRFLALKISMHAKKDDGFF
jgi:hypothetical protein